MMQKWTSEEAITKKVYLCGRVSGIPNGNAEAFQRAEDVLTKLGYEVINPLKLGMSIETPWNDAMRTCISSLIKAHGVAVLPEPTIGSKGATLEQHIARSIGMPVRGVWEWEWLATQDSTNRTQGIPQGNNTTKHQGPVLD